jgi:hypothetical protein
MGPGWFECWNIGGEAMSTESDKPEGWLDFKEVKAKASMPVVLKYLKLTEQLEKKEDEWIGFCPFHPEKGKADSFHVSESKKAFHCFACKRKGSVLDLVQLLLAYRGESVTLREAADWIKCRMQQAQWEEDRGQRAEQDRLDVGAMDAAEVARGPKAPNRPAPPPMPAEVHREAVKPEKVEAVEAAEEPKMVFDASGFFLDFAEACRLVTFNKAHARDFVAVRAADLIGLLQALSGRKK